MPCFKKNNLEFKVVLHLTHTRYDRARIFKIVSSVRKHSCFPFSSPWFETHQRQDFFSLLLSLWTALRSNTSSAEKWISQMQSSVKSRAKHYKKVVQSWINRSFLSILVWRASPSAGPSVQRPPRRNFFSRILAGRKNFGLGRRRPEDSTLGPRDLQPTQRTSRPHRHRLLARLERRFLDPDLRRPRRNCQNVEHSGLLQPVRPEHERAPERSAEWPERPERFSRACSDLPYPVFQRHKSVLLSSQHLDRHRCRRRQRRQCLRPRGQRRRHQYHQKLPDPQRQWDLLVFVKLAETRIGLCYNDFSFDKTAFSLFRTRN